MITEELQNDLETTDQVIHPNPAPRRINFLIPETSYRELQEMTNRTKRSMTDLIRYGLGMMRILLEAHTNGHRLVVVDKSGRAIKEIVMPM